MPVWGVWEGRALWFSCGPRSRKARNLGRGPRATATIDDPNEPVVVEGTVQRVHDPAATATAAGLMNTKYHTGYSVEFFLANAMFRLVPAWVFGLTQEDFTGSPTRWHFGQG